MAPPGRILWLTGLSGSGKTTLAQALARRLEAEGRPCEVLDGDVLRQGPCRDLGFSPADRRENIRRAGELAMRSAAKGRVCIVALISPYAADRAQVRAVCPPGVFREVHLCTPLAICETRDPKGLYRRARMGALRDFTGVDAPYEMPERPELRLDTDALDVAACVERLLAQTL